MEAGTSKVAPGAEPRRPRSTAAGTGPSRRRHPAGRERDRRPHHHRPAHLRPLRAALRRRLADLEPGAAAQRPDRLRDRLLPDRLRDHGRLPPPLHPPQLRHLPAGCAASSAALGSAAIEGPVISWVADHRKHHACSDREGDPHSPHVGHGSGWKGALKGFFHAHVGWIFIHTQRGNKQRFAPDLIADPVVSFVDRTFFLWAVLGFVVAFALGFAIGGDLTAGLTGHALGRCGAGVRAPPRHLQHQLALPHVRPPALRDQGRVAQPGLAGAADDGRGLAQQPPRLPDLGPPRTRALAARPLGAGDQRDWRSSAWSGTWSRSRPSARPPKPPPRWRARQRSQFRG